MSLFSKKISESETALISLQAQFDELNSLYDTSKNEVVSLTESLATVNGEFARVSEEVESLKLQLKESEEAIIEVAIDAAEVNTIASNKALDIVAGLGVAPISISNDEESIDIMDQLKSLKGQELVSFYQEHKEEIAKRAKI